MKTRSSAVLVALCLSATSMIAAPQARQDAAQVAVDPNGSLRQPTAAEQQDLAAKAAAARPARSFVRLAPKAHANGMVSIALDDSFDHAYVVRTNEDGSLVFACTTHDDASHFVAETASIDTIMRVKPVTTPAQRIRTAERE